MVKIDYFIDGADTFVSKYWKLFLVPVLLMLYGPSLYSLPFGDDYGFIFNSPAITNAPHPFVYWFKESGESRSWPLSYSVFWCLYKVYGQNFFLYKLTNLLSHAVNAILLSRVLKRLEVPHRVFVVFLYVIHPVHVESIMWIFQLKTILSITFFLISYDLFLQYLKSKRIVWVTISLLFFVISLLTKITAVAAPLLFLYHSYQSSFHKIKKLLISLPFFFASFYLGVISVNGLVAYGAIEAKLVKKLTNYYYSPSLPLLNQPVNVDNSDLKFSTPLESFVYYASDLVKIDEFFIKSAIVMNATVFYLKSFLGMAKNYLVYPNLNLHSWSASLSVVIFCALLLGLIFFHHNQVRFGMFFFFIGAFPILGYFYVPYMKNSYVADHWNYLGAIGLAIALGSFTILLCEKVPVLKNRKWLMISVVFLFFGYRTYSYSSVFLQKDKLHEENIEINPKALILYEYLFKLKMDQNDYKGMERLIPVLYTRKLDRFETYRTKQQYISYSDQINFIKIYFALNMVDPAREIASHLYRSYPDNKEIIFLQAMLNKDDPNTSMYLDKLFLSFNK